MLENEKFEKKEVSGEEIWKKNGRVKSEKCSFEGCGQESGKMREKEGLKMKNEGTFGGLKLRK